MSMIARFVAITPDQLATIKDTPEMVGGVFALDAGLPFESPSDLQERLRRQAPQLVADMLERLPPAVRQQLRRRLGLGENDLPNPGAGNAVLLQLAQREAARRRAPPAPGAPGHSVSLDKAWHGLHYLLCGKLEPAPGPLGQAVFGGSEIGEDRGYGPARYFAPSQVAEIASALRSPGLEQELYRRFDGAAMTQLGIYPGVWETDDHDWLIEAFRTLRDFYAAASEAEQAVVTLIE
jgi:hypothetical protein